MPSPFSIIMDGLKLLYSCMILIDILKYNYVLMQDSVLL